MKISFTLIASFIMILPTISKYCRSIQRIDLMEEWKVKDDSILCKKDLVIEIQYSVLTENNFRIDLETLLDSNWLTERDPSHFSISLKTNMENVQALLVFEETENNSMVYQRFVNKSVSDSGVVFSNVILVKKGEIERFETINLSLIEDLQLIIASVMSILCFTITYGSFAMSFMAMYSIGSVLLAYIMADASSIVTLIFVCFGLACISVLWGYANLTSCSKSLLISQALAMSALYVIPSPSSFRKKFWDLAFLVWLNVGIFLFSAAKVGFTSSGIACFIIQGLKFSQLLVVWLVAGVISPVEMRMRISSYPVVVYNRSNHQEITLWYYLHKFVCSCLVIIVMISVTLHLKRRTRNQRYEDFGDNVMIIGRDSEGEGAMNMV